MLEIKKNLSKICHIIGQEATDFVRSEGPHLFCDFKAWIHTIWCSAHNHESLNLN